MCPDRESNWQPFVLQDDAEPTKPHWLTKEMNLHMKNPNNNMYVQKHPTLQVVK